MQDTLGPCGFPTTHWNVIAAAGDVTSTAMKEAWEQLAQAYWRPLYGHARRRGYHHEDARDLVQGFFARMIEKPIVQAAQPARGRFRTFLLASLDHFLANEYDRRMTLKRGGRLEFIPLSETRDRTGAEPAASSSEEGFDRDWADCIMARALGRLESEFAHEGKLAHYAVLSQFLVQFAFPGDYEAAAAKLGLRPEWMPKLVFRLRQRLRKLVREEVSQTVNSLREVDTEVRYLVELLAS